MKAILGLLLLAGMAFSLAGTNSTESLEVTVTSAPPAQDAGSTEALQVTVAAPSAPVRAYRDTETFRIDGGSLWELDATQEPEGPEIFTGRTDNKGVVSIHIIVNPGERRTIVIRVKGSSKIAEIETLSSSLYINLRVKLNKEIARNKDVQIEIY